MNLNFNKKDLEKRSEELIKEQFDFYFKNDRKNIKIDVEENHEFYTSKKEFSIIIFNYETGGTVCHLSNLKYRNIKKSFRYIYNWVNN